MPAASGELTVPGCTLRYWRRGTGIPVVLTHGAGGEHHAVSPQERYLARAGYEVVTWDLRGHGASRPSDGMFTAEVAVADLVALVTALELDRPVLVGLSFGGNLSQQAVREHPDLARGLVAIGCGWNQGPLSFAEKALLHLVDPALRLVPPSRLPAVLAALTATNPKTRRRLTEAFTTFGRDELLHVWEAPIDLLDPDPQYRTPVPLCLIRGEQDRTGNVARSMPRWARHDGVPEHVIPAAGHVTTLDAPELVNSTLGDFLSGLAKRS